MKTKTKVLQIESQQFREFLNQLIRDLDANGCGDNFRLSSPLLRKIPNIDAKATLECYGEHGISCDCDIAATSRQYLAEQTKLDGKKHFLEFMEYPIAGCIE
jgi:hypothetical protein